MTEFTMTIGGAPAPTETTFPVINPATGEPFAEAPECTRQQLDSAFEAASKAFDDWRNDEKVRREALQHAGELLAANADEIAPVLTAEQGKPLANARAEVLGASMGLTGAAALEFRREVLQDDAAARRGRPAPARGGGRHHGVELPGRPRLGEDWAGAARREHRRPEAVAVHAAVDAAHGRGDPRGVPAGRGEHRERGRRARGVDDEPPAR